MIFAGDTRAGDPMRVITKIAAGMLAVSAMATAAYAETLQVTGEFSARYRDASLSRSLSIDRFDGQDGIALANAIERAMGRTHFQMMGGRAGRNNAEASLSGAVTTEVDESAFRRKEKRCVEKGKDGKCIEQAEVELRCRRRVVNVRADLRLVHNGSGRVLYTESKPFRDEASWCEGQNPSRSVEDAVTAGIENIARDVRYDLAPSVETYQIRVRESTKGLSKESAARFKELVKLTKRDARGACAGWRAMPEAANHPSLLFNLGLCAEQRGEYDAALALYRQAHQYGANEGGDGAGRAQRLIAGREDARERARRR